MAQTTMTRTPEAAAADIEAQLASLKGDIAALSRAMADFGRLQGKALGEAAAEQAGAAADKGRRTAQALIRSAETGYSDAEDMVKANPAAAIGLAAGFGFVFGLLSARR